MKVTVNGHCFEVLEKMTILDLAREKGIDIPSLCHYPGLKPFSACRLCLVAVKGRKIFSPACSTPIEEGMDVTTNSPALHKIRRQILELILSERANDCLICGDRSRRSGHPSTTRGIARTAECSRSSIDGPCDFRKAIDALKPDLTKYPPINGALEIRTDDPLFDRDYNLCILCGRCVRVCHEVRGVSALAFVNRGSRTMVGTPLGRRLFETSCQFCGACLDVCLTGALTEKSRKAGVLPDAEKVTVCGFCGQGCHLTLALQQGKILGSVPAKLRHVHQGQACVKGRFLVAEAVYHRHRIVRPMVRRDGKLKETTWDAVLTAIAQKWSGFEARDIAIVGSAQDSCQDVFALQKFGREGLKTENIIESWPVTAPARFRHFGRAQGLLPRLNFDISDIGRARTIVLFGENLTVSQPIVWLEVYRAVRRGAKLIIVGPQELCIRRCASSWIKLQPGQEIGLLTGISRILLESSHAPEFAKIDGFDVLKKSLEEIKLSEVAAGLGFQEEKMLKLALLLEKRRPVVFLFGTEFCSGSPGAANLAALWNLALQTQASLMVLASENNARGVLEISESFHKLAGDRGRIIQDISGGSFKALYLVNALLRLDKKPAAFLVVQDSYLNGNSDFADIVLPQTTFAEAEGIFVNVEGRPQKFEQAIEPWGDSKPGWWIVSELARKMGIAGFSYKSAADVFQDLASRIPAFQGLSRERPEGGIFLVEPEPDGTKFAPVGALEACDGAASLSGGPDNYKGLDMGRDIKDLRLIRGR